MDCGHQCPSVCGEPCPPLRYCQQCCSDTIKGTCVDFLEMREYHEVDLDIEPCIFPDCGHFLTVTSMDGQMNMGDHYTLDANGLPSGINKASEPFSMDQGEPIRVCPTCRGSLRNIARYGRIVRRGMLDEATKKFISWSNTTYLGLAEALVVERERLADAKLPSNDATTCFLPTGRPPRSRNDHFDYLVKLLQPVGQREVGNPSATGGRKQSPRYLPVIRLWGGISAFEREVRREEQPFQRVADLVRHANLLRHLSQEEDNNDDAREFHYDESVIQVKGQLLARALLLKCEIMVFDDLVRLVSAKNIIISAPIASGSDGATAQGPSWSGMLKVEIYLKECDRFITLAENTKHPKEQVQGHVFAALFCGFARALGERDQAEHRDSAVHDSSPMSEKAKLDNGLKQTGLKHISLARAITKEYPSTISGPSTLAAEIDSADRFLTGGTFYEAVTSEELRAVFEAMSGEFSGTGHWYTCQNGHPFTVGECGMPMEQARCSECGAPVGGLGHQPAVGVRRDDQMEEMARGVNGLGI